MDYIKVLEEFLAIDTTVPPGRNYDRAVSYLEPLFKEVGFSTQVVNIPPQHARGREGRVNLIAHRRQPGKPRLIFYGHLDVVPAEGWAAFTPRIADGKIYGRGAGDMKGSIVSLLIGLEKVKARPLAYDISVMLTTDEEVDQSDQLEYLRPYLQPVSGALFFSLDASFGYVGITNLGVIHIDIGVKGRSVHSALANLGENAVEKAARLVDALLELKKTVVQRKSRIDVHPGTGLRKMEARLNINRIQGGLKFNIVPDHCLITVDRRLIPEENVEDARRELLDTLSAVPDVEWEIENAFIIPPVPPCQDPAIDRLADIIQEVSGETGKLGEMGSGDLPHIVAGWGGKEFGLGVIRAEANIHGKDEFAYLADIEALGEIIARFVSEG